MTMVLKRRSRFRKDFRDFGLYRCRDTEDFHDFGLYRCAILIAIVATWINHNLFFNIENHNNCIGIRISENRPFFKTLKTIVNEIRLC